MKASMKVWSKHFLPATIVLMLLALCTTAAMAETGAAIGPYLVTNDNVNGGSSPKNSATIYKINTDGTLTLVNTLPTGGNGNGGGFFAVANANVIHSKTQPCAFVADGNPNFSTQTSPDVAGINLSTLAVTGTFAASSSDNAGNAGMGLADAGKFLVASFSGNSTFKLGPTIGTYRVQTGCKLKYLGSIAATGKNGGLPDGTKVTPNGKTLVVAYADGSVGSYSISSTGALTLIGQELTTTGAFAAGVDITADGKWAIFGDANINPVQVDVAPIMAGGVLGATVNYKPFTKTALNGNNVLLSPDESLLFLDNNSSGTVSAAPFNKKTGVVNIAKSCTSDILNLFDVSWFFGGNMNFSKTTSTGGKLYLAEGGFPPAGIGIIKYHKLGKGEDEPCELVEDPSSPVSDPADAFGLNSIGRYPPRAF
jgi:6-phosphogluconolactonase (cycloisomerase 2 family)